MLAPFKFLSQDEAAAAAVEYALLLSVVALVALGAILQLGGGLQHLYQHVGALFRRQGS